jgi:hypothetical protein
LDGRFTQGVFGDDLRWLDAYSGPASAFWGTRSVVLFWYAGRSIAWEAVPSRTLPSMSTSVERQVTGLQATVETVPGEALSCVAFPTCETTTHESLPRARTWKDHARQLVWAVASRPANNLLDAGKRRFCSTQAEYR